MYIDLSICVLIIVIVIAIFSVFSPRKKTVREGIFGEADENNALSALDDLFSQIDQGRVQEVDGNYLMQNADQIEMAKVNDQIALQDADKEHMTFFHPVNTQYWPYYFYSQPYQYQDGGAWPPGMKSRLYNWQPGFETSGWSYWLRPGMAYTRWPRSRWVKQNGSYYFINNGGLKDRLRDYTGEPS